MRSMILTAALGMALVGSTATRAEARWWSSNAASCAPGDPAIQADRYTIGAGSVKHKPGASGLITLYCPVNFSATGFVVHYDPLEHEWATLPACLNQYSMRQTYTDSDGTGAGVSSAAS